MSPTSLNHTLNAIQLIKTFESKLTGTKAFDFLHPFGIDLRSRSLSSQGTLQFHPCLKKKLIYEHSNSCQYFFSWLFSLSNHKSDSHFNFKFSLKRHIRMLKFNGFNTTLHSISDHLRHMELEAVELAVKRIQKAFKVRANNPKPGKFSLPE